MRDLVVLVADKSMEFALRAGFERPESLGIRHVTVEFRQHPNRDGGTRTTGVQILALEHSRFRHALLVFDHEGSGTSESPQDLETGLDVLLSQTWADKAKSIVIEPELDVWMWGSDNVLTELLRWPKSESIREWLTNQGFTFQTNGKPTRPKEALEAIFTICHLARSAANYQMIASRVSIARCADPAFLRLREQLQIWFPQDVT
jgi:hypothetical protein